MEKELTRIVILRKYFQGKKYKNKQNAEFVTSYRERFTKLADETEDFGTSFCSFAQGLYSAPLHPSQCSN